MTDLILSLDDLLSGQEPALHKTSLFGGFPFQSKLFSPKNFLPISRQRVFGITVSLPRVINFKLPLQPHQKYYITQYEELDLS